MKKKVRLLLFALLSILIFQVRLFAVCNDEELNNLAEKINVSLVEDIEIIGEDNNVEREKKYLYLLSFGETLSGMKDKIKIEVTDSISNKKYNATYDDFFDTFVIGSEIHFVPKVYNIIVLGGSNSKCPNEKIKVFSHRVNAYNTYRDTEYCSDHLDEDLCSIDFDSSKFDDEDFANLVKPNEVPELNFFGKVWNFIKNYWYFVVIPIVVISIFYIVLIVIYKKKGSRE